MLTTTDEISWFPSGKSVEGAIVKGADAGNRYSLDDDSLVPSGASRGAEVVAGDPEGVACMGKAATKGDGLRVFMPARDDGEARRAMGDVGPVGVLAWSGARDGEPSPTS